LFFDDKYSFICLQGAFLIPYFVLYFLIGAPIYYLELALGQFSSRGPATAFIFAKGWRGKKRIEKI
jgi:SNF family Na+-dependent transporter